MSPRAWRPNPAILGLVSCLTACKPEAPTETHAAGSPAEGPAQVADSAQIAPSSDGPDSALAATSPGLVEDPPAGTLDAPPQTAPVEAVALDSEPETPAVPEQPYKVLMLGDSLIATGIGALLEKKLDAHPHVVCYRKGKSSSGLARPDFYDWVDQAKRQVEFRQPDLVIVILGGNDGQDLTRRSGKGKRVPWQHEDWTTAYRARMDAFLAEITGPERRVLWIGLPYMGLRSFEKKLTLIRGVQREALEALGESGVYLDSLPFVTNEDGGMLRQAKVGPRGKFQTLRAEDNIHFTMAGSEYFADRVYPTVLEVLALPDVQPDP